MSTPQAASLSDPIADIENLPVFWSDSTRWQAWISPDNSPVDMKIFLLICGTAFPGNTISDPVGKRKRFESIPSRYTRSFFIVGNSRYEFDKFVSNRVHSLAN